MSVKRDKRALKKLDSLLRELSNHLLIWAIMGPEQKAIGKFQRQKSATQLLERRTLNMETRNCETLGVHPEYRSIRHSPSSLLMGCPQPFEAEPITDDAVTTPLRAWGRRIVFNAETSARFERQNHGGDPVTWMFARGSLLGGATAVEVCKDRTAFALAMDLHLVGRHLYFHPETSRRSRRGSARSQVDDQISSLARQGPLTRVSPVSPMQRRLFTSTIVGLSGEATLHVFHATMASNALEIRTVLIARYGLRLANLARTAQGFDPSDPIAVAMVSDAVGHTLELVAGEPMSPLADGLDIQLEARFMH